MQFIFKCLLVLSFLLPTFAHSQDIEADEIAVRETPQSLFDSLNRTLNLTIEFHTQAEFDQLAADVGFSRADLLHHLQLIARLNMESAVNNPNKKIDAAKMIEQLMIISQTQQEQATWLIMKGRYLGRYEQNYAEAISHYNQALNLINDYDDHPIKLLKFTIYEHLSTLHILVRQENIAFTYLNQLRDLAYELRNNYLITVAESELGFYYNKTNSLTKALQHYSEAFRLTNNANYPLQRTKLQLKLAQVYRDLKQWDDALKNAHEAANGFEALGNDPYLSSCMTVIAMVYEQQNQWNKAIDYYLNAQQIDQRRGNLIAQGLNYHNLGSAYAKLDDNVNAFAYLMKANQIFKEKNTKHYLVVNELQLAEVAQTQQNWLLSMERATEALRFATELNLIDEQIKALTLQATSYRQQGLFTQALDNQDKIIELNEHKNLTEEETDPNDYSSSMLTEQKLKIELALLQSKANRAAQSIQYFQISLLLLALLLLIAIMAILQLWRSRQKWQLENQRLSDSMNKDPITAHYGYPALLEQLTQANATKPKAIALISIESQHNSDLQLGVTDSKKRHNSQLNALALKLDAKTFYIRPGLFALSFTRLIDGQWLEEECRALFHTDNEEPSLRIGLLNLPLMANVDIKIDAVTHFEVLQMALYGARSLPDAACAYVSFKTLDFAPVSIFNQPLFLHLSKAIERGLVRVDTSGNKEAIQWPQAEID